MPCLLCLGRLALYGAGPVRPVARNSYNDRVVRRKEVGTWGCQAVKRSLELVFGWHA